MCASAVVPAVEAQLQAAPASAGVASLAAALQEGLVRALLDLQQRVAGTGMSGGCTATVVLQVGGWVGQACSEAGWAGTLGPGCGLLLSVPRGLGLRLAVAPAAAIAPSH